MSKAKEREDRFPHVKGLAKKRTKFGHRWILTEQDSMGKSRSITVKILDTDPVDVFYRKVNDARLELRRKDKEKTFDEYFKDFTIINQLSRCTVRCYHYSLQGMGLNPKKNREIVREIVNSGRKASTKALYISHINHFFDWLIKHGVPIQNPALDVRIREITQPRLRIATTEEMEVIIRYAETRVPEYRLFVLLLIHTGARLSTIERLQACDMQDGRLSLFNVKSRKRYDYKIPVSSNIVNLWNEVARDGILWHDSPSAHRLRFQRWMHYRFSKDSNGECLSPHSLRHTFASKAVQNGVSIDVVSKLLDHASASTTLKVYARFSQDQIDDAVNRAMGKKNACDCCDQSQASVSSSQVGAAQKKAASSEQN